MFVLKLLNMNTIALNMNNMATTESNFKWRALIGLVFIYVAVFMNWNWVWGILFLIWVLPDLLTGLTHFMEPVERSKNPFMYWAIMGTWILLSVYLIATLFFPKLDMGYTNNHGLYNKSKVEAVAEGTYQPETGSKAFFNPLNRVDESSSEKSTGVAIEDVSTKKSVINEQVSSNLEKNVDQEEIPKRQKIAYKTYDSPAINIVGISTPTSYDTFESDLSQLWEYFFKEDISPAIPDITDDKLYVVYSDYNNNGEFKATIGYKTKTLNNIYEGLTGITIPASSFAVFEIEGNPEKGIPDMWEKIFNSNVNRADTYDLEVYQINSTTYETESASIWCALK